MKKAYFRFYEELNDFLPAEKRKVDFSYEFFGTPSVKDAIESLGIPHTEVDLILVNGNSVDFEYLLKDNDKVSVYPVFESFDLTNIQHLRPAPLREPKFILDVHLGTLAKYLRLLGFDIYYHNNLSDEQIIRISLEENRAIVTRDKGLLKHGIVTHGYFVRSQITEEQVLEVIKRFQLENKINEFSRCLDCNSNLTKVNKKDVINEIPEKIKLWHEEFKICPNCGKVYWKGSHYSKMIDFINELKSKIQK